MKRNSLKFRMLVPLFVVLSFLILAFSVSFHRLQKKQIVDASFNKFNAVRDLFWAQLENDANMLGATIEVIIHDEQTIASLKGRDANALFARNQPLYNELHSKNRVTHFYFTGSDRVNILRLHQPTRNGDTINRFTTLEAEKTGKPAYGIELGPLGTFTLRMVVPCFDAGQLIGYIELGEEIEHITEIIHEILGVELYVLIDKEYIKRKGWESGMRMLGRVSDWDQFPHTVLVDMTVDDFPLFLADFLSQKQDTSLVGIKEISLGGRLYQSTFLRLQDAGSRWVGDIVILHDITDILSRLYNTTFVAVLICITVGGALFTFFYIIVGRIERQLDGAERELQCLANLDGLTQIANRRTFDETLDTEWRRMQREGGTISLIMCDIDFFKLYNDTYGHQLGDDALCDVAKAISKSFNRAGDFVGRYGGEEFIVILPNTAAEGAMNIAETVRMNVQQLQIAHEKPTVHQYLTLSLGVAVMVPSQESSAKTLIHMADKALYEAKRRGKNCAFLGSSNENDRAEQHNKIAG